MRAAGRGRSLPGMTPLPRECDVCGSTDVREIRCKVICGNCGTILQSCADLKGEGLGSEGLGSRV